MTSIEIRGAFDAVPAFEPFSLEVRGVFDAPTFEPFSLEVRGVFDAPAPPSLAVIRWIDGDWYAIQRRRRNDGAWAII